MFQVAVSDDLRMARYRLPDREREHNSAHLWELANRSIQLYARSTPTEEEAFAPAWCTFEAPKPTYRLATTSDVLNSLRMISDGELPC